MKKGILFGIVDSMSSKVKILLTLPAFMLFPLGLLAQDGSDNGDGNIAAPDTGTYDEFSTESDSGDNAEPEVTEAAKPYVRVVLPFDTVTELVTYTYVVEQASADGLSGADSLYWRTKKWVEAKFGKKVVKNLIVEDKNSEKIVIKGYFDLYMTPNKYVQSRNGIVRFTMTVRFKDERYKIVINNLVHELPPTPNSNNKPIVTYFEYYTTCTVNIKQNDKVLLAADKEINKMVTNFKKSLKDPILIDEEDW